jgi:hypothetical protein
MKNNAKSIIALPGAVALAGLLCQTAPAQLVIDPLTTVVLADAFGTATGPEAVTITTEVTETAGVYTYSYIVNNPSGDVLLNANGSPTSTPESVDAFSVSFNTTAPGAFVPGSQTGGVYDSNNLVGGLFWAFDAINAGNSGPTLSFVSDEPPTLGNANAQDANPPSPWSSAPNGQQVPVPSDVPEPATMTLLALTALVLGRFVPRLKSV